MKKVLSLIIVIFPIFLFSQNKEQKQKVAEQSNSAVLKSFSDRSKIDFFKEKSKAVEMAKKFNWPLTLEKENTFSELVGVSKENLPIYYSTFNEGAGITSRANKLYSGGSLGLDINGENMTAGVWDGAAGLTTHELFSGRLQVLDNTQYTHPHASHVAGTVIGTNLVENGKAKGMAYKGKVNSYDWNNDIGEVAIAAADGLLLSNHSYGRNPNGVPIQDWGKYDLSSQGYDEIMFNAPFYQFVCAAGNSRGNFNSTKNGYDVITGHALSKNGITVAAVKEVLNYTGPNSVEMSSFSSWGPTDDGRIKPDISAKGVDTYSALDGSNSSYGTYSGTSMASPSVVGTLMLYQQYYNQLNGNFMKASTLRGLMIHTADEAGPAKGPDYAFGWGLLNAEKAADVIKKNQTQSFILENTLEQNNSYSITVNSNGAEPLLATLCWTDPKGNLPDAVLDSSNPELVNDLDIRITQNSSTTLPWKLDVATPNNSATKGDNLVDNVEKIEVENATGSYTITVTNKGTLVNNLQNYSLIISGINVKDFWLSTNQKTKSICEGIASVDFNFDLKTKSNFNETITYSTIGLPAGITAIFNPTTMSAAGSFGLTLSDLTFLSPGRYTFDVKATTATDSFEMPITIVILAPTFQNSVLVSPSNNETNINLPVVFNWQADVNAQQFDIEIASNVDFTDIIQSSTVNSNSFTSTVLLNNSTYFWRIKPKNSCNSGIFSTTNSFSTVCKLPSNLVQLSASTTTASLGWTENSGGTSWLVEVVPEGVLPTGNGTLITTNPYSLTGLTPNTCYDFYIKSNCGLGTSSWTKKTKFCTQPDYCAGDHFVDSGGLTGNYSNFENKTTTIFPVNSGERTKAIFNSFDLETGWDYLRIFNGPNSNYPLLFSGTGNIIPAYFASSDLTGALTFVFTSDNIGTGSGWDATIICEPMPACPQEPNNISVSNLTYNSANINWTENTNATSWNIEIVASGATPTGIGTLITSKPYMASNLASNTSYDVYLQSNCTAGTSSWSTPVSFITPGNYCAGDHFYDNGGTNGNYTQNNFQQTIYPDTSGDRISITFNSFDINNYDTFYVFNGSNTNSQILFNSDNGNNLNPGTLKATNLQGALTFVFYNYGFNNKTGWDATIVCETLPPCPNPPSNFQTNSGEYQNNIQISWSENSGANLWEIEVVPQGTTPTGAGITLLGNFYTQNGLTSNTWFDYYVRSKCSNGNSEWSSKNTFYTKANYCAGDHFYDDGGPNGDLKANYNYFEKTIRPAVSGDRIKAIFNSFQLATSDSFKVYDGYSYNSTLLYSGTGNSAPPTTLVATNPEGFLTFLHQKQNNSVTQGWDATIVCEPLPPCSNEPSNVSLNSISTTSATFNWQENSNSNSWEVEIVPQGTVPSGIGTIITSNPYKKTGLTSNSWYDFYVRSICGSVNSEWSLKTSFNTLANYCAGDHFYDDGGPNSNYPQNYYNDQKTIYPTGTGNRIKATFISFQLASNDTFIVLNGAQYNAPVLYSGNSMPTTELIATNPQGCLTFILNRQSNQTASGWDATIVCEPLPPCSNAPNSVYSTNITTTSATFYWQENSNATSWEVEIVPLGTTPTGIGTLITSNPYTKTGLTSNSWYDFYVRSKCGNVNSAWTLKSSFNTKANYCDGDHFYDNGGPNGNYNNNNGSQYVTIYPTGIGNRVKATFNSFQVSNNANFTVSDGNTIIFERNSNNQNVPTTLTATNPQGTLTFNFYEYNNNNLFAGWDATIVCEPLPPCSNAPTNVYLYNTTTNSAQFSWTENSNATSWEVEFVQQGTTPTGVGTIINSNPYTKTGLTSNTWYDFYVRSKCGNINSAWTLKKSFNTEANYCDGDHFYDNGGPNGNYNNNNGSLYFSMLPSNNGDRVKAIFNLFQINQNSTFKVYDGYGQSSSEIFNFNGSNSPGTLTATNPQGVLTFYFYDYSGNTNSGWDATIVCEPLPPCSNAPSNVGLYNNVSTNSAQLSWAENSNATSWEVEFVLQDSTPTGIGTTINSNPYTKTGLTSNTWYDFYVRSKCGSTNSVWTGPFKFNTNADYCAGDHFYDNGGPNGNYNNNNGSLYFSMLPSNNGDRVKAIFNLFQINQNSTFKVYDGYGQSSPEIFNFNGSNSPGTLTATNPQGVLTFYFYDYSGNTNSGWDATIVCEPLPPCSNAPTNVYLNSITTNSAQFNWTENSNATSWEVEIVPQGTTSTGIGTTINSNPYTKTGLTSNTWYDFYVRSKCGSTNSVWTGPFKFNTNADYCAGDHFYDDGGPNGNYIQYNSLNKTIYPTGTGNRVKATFNSFQLNNNDSFNVYDGNILIFSRDNNNPISPTFLAATNPQGTLTFQFYSNNSQTFAGWDATIVCEPLPPCLNPPSNVASGVITTTTAILNWVENSNANSWEIEFVPKGTIPTGIGTIVNSKPYTKSELTPNTWYDFYVRSKCGNVNSTWSLKSSFNTLANYCAGDHFYDNGGPKGNYESYQSQYITINPSTIGERIKAVFNSFDVNQNINFTVYDGGNPSAPILFSWNSSNPSSPSSIVATSQTGNLTFVFNNNSTQTNTGWDATIICEPIPGCTYVPANLFVDTITNNKASINWTEYSSSTSWELEVVPAGNQPIGIGTIINSNPYILTGLSTNSCYEYYIRSVCGTSNSAWTEIKSFCTTPNYCGGTNFYDTGGPNGNYQNNENYTTVIYPENPTDKITVVFNTFQLQLGNDLMRIYNGPSSSSPQISVQTGTNSPGTVTSTHQTGSLAFFFFSNGNNTNVGWEATVQCSTLDTSNQNFNYNLIEYYPNPVLDLLNIKSKKEIEKYEVYDINSRLISSEKINKTEFTIDSSKFSSGIYFVKLFDKEGVSKEIKIVKNK